MSREYFFTEILDAFVELEVGREMSANVFICFAHFLKPFLQAHSQIARKTQMSTDGTAAGKCLVNSSRHGLHVS